jgi:hypothetical protein
MFQRNELFHAAASPRPTLGFAEPPEERTIEYDEQALRHFEEEV